MGCFEAEIDFFVKTIYLDKRCNDKVFGKVTQVHF